MKPSAAPTQNLQIHLLSSANTQGSTLVVFASSEKKAGATTSQCKILDKTLQGRLEKSIADKMITGKAREICLFREFGFPESHGQHRHLVVAGLGEKWDAETLRKTAAEIYKSVSGLHSKEIVIDLDEAVKSKKDVGPMLQALVEGLQLASYSFTEMKSKADTDKTLMSFHIVTDSAKDKSVKDHFARGIILAECANFSRRLGDMPANRMTPTMLANEAIAAGKTCGLKVTAWDKAKIEKERMGGLLGVSMGSTEEPRFIIMEYKGAAASKKPVIFVGKGLTFDCGGISIKPAAGMEEMKYDMCGGANVIGTMLAIAKLKLKINAIGLVPSTENLAGPAATKPGDVHTARNGKTFEVNNTDAEGRLILADALSYASELKPEVIIDAATLTGAMVMALSNIHTGYFTKDKALKSKIEHAATTSGELVWNMPLTEEHLKDMKGTYADLSNISSGKGAGSATAAAFLEQFVGEGLSWAHFDIAGTGWGVGNRLPWCSAKGASGVMVRTFLELAESYS